MAVNGITDPLRPGVTYRIRYLAATAAVRRSIAKFTSVSGAGHLVFSREKGNAIEVIVLARSDLLAAVPQRMNLKYAEWEDAGAVSGPRISPG